MNKQLICIIGPTGVGKTELSISLAKALNTEIISCDSRQMFREMSVGTAVPSATQLSEVKHHFVQSISIYDYYSVYEYELDANRLLMELFRENDQVLLSGGSGLYLDALLFGMDDIPDPDPLIREELENRFNSEGLSNMLQELEMLDPEYYAEVDKNNSKRVIRGLEVCLTTGKTFSNYRIRSPRKREFDAKIICLDRERSVLHQRINERVDEMILKGLVEEAKSLYPLRQLNALKTVGYRELFDAFDGNIGIDEAISLIKRNSRRYARRQITWNKKYQDAVWFDAGEMEKILAYTFELAGKE
jgi:tRNA dimethylallyltransferase